MNEIVEQEYDDVKVSLEEEKPTRSSSRHMSINSLTDKDVPITPPSEKSYVPTENISAHTTPDINNAAGAYNTLATTGPVASLEIEPYDAPMIYVQFLVKEETRQQYFWVIKELAKLSEVFRPTIERMQNTKDAVSRLSYPDKWILTDVPHTATNTNTRNDI